MVQRSNPVTDYELHVMSWIAQVKSSVLKKTKVCGEFMSSRDKVVLEYFGFRNTSY